MTKEKFSQIKWTGNMFAVYNNTLYAVANCDFEEYTIGLVQNELDEPIGVPCEEVEVQEVLSNIPKGTNTDILRKGRFDINYFSKLHSADFPDIESRDIERLGSIMINIIKRTSRTKAFIDRRFKGKKKNSFKSILRKKGAVGEFLWAGGK